MNYVTLEGIGVDVGRFAARVLPEDTSYADISAFARAFVETFATNINMENVQERETYLFHVGRGLEMARTGDL